MIKRLALRAAAAPFEAAIAAIITLTPILNWVGWDLVDPLDALLPDWLVLALRVTYLLAGLAIIVGILIPRGDIEGAGLVVLSTSLLLRGFLFGQYLGWDARAATSVIFYVFVAFAASLRLIVLSRARGAMVVAPIPPEILE